MTLHAHAGYRPDIDGLRALAVLSVVAFHAFPQWVPGGYIGVDVFFVISGYLISRIILEKTARSEFSFADFYARRVRRIFPALLLVLVTCYVAGWLTLLAEEFDQLGTHIAAGAGFLSNIVLWHESGYFDNASETKPLLHLWSLGVEEQFYIVWPLAIWALYRLRSKLGWALAGLLLCSFVVNLATVRSHPVAAFYSPASRFWELLIGAGLAHLSLVAPERLRALRQHANVLALVAAALFVFVLFFIDKHSAFPGWWAVLPVAAAALWIGGNQQSWFARRVLCHPLMVGIGLISYPLYLWHWPVLTFARIASPGPLAHWQTALLVGVSVLLAWLSYQLVEKHVRWKGRKTTIVLVVLMVLIGFAGWNAHQRKGMEFRYVRMLKVPPAQARDLAKWEHKGLYPKGECAQGFTFPDAHLCAVTRPGAPPDMAVLGDSHAFAAYWGISKSFGERGHNVVLLGRGSGCLPFVDQPNVDCREAMNQQLQWITNNSGLKTVFISHRNNLASAAPPADKAMYEASLRKTLQLLSTQKKVVYLLAVAEARTNPRLCVGSTPMGRTIDRSQCRFPAERELKAHEAYRTLVLGVLKDFPAVEVVDPIPWQCPDGQCTVSTATQVLWSDDNHLSESGSYVQGRALAAHFSDSSRLPPPNKP